MQIERLIGKHILLPIVAMAIASIFNGVRLQCSLMNCNLSVAAQWNSGRDAASAMEGMATAGEKGTKSSLEL